MGARLQPLDRAPGGRDEDSLDLMETSIVVELKDLGDRTRMVMTHIGVPADSPGGQGWAMATDKLDARVKELQNRRTRL